MPDLSPITDAERAHVETDLSDPARWSTDEVADLFEKADPPGDLVAAYFAQRGLGEFQADPRTVRETRSWRTRPDARREWPAILFAATDDDGRVTAVQAVPLKVSGENGSRTVERARIDGKAQKWTAGRLGDPVRFQGGGSREHLVEGPEDAATLAMVTGETALAALGLRQIGKIRSRRAVVTVHADRGSEEEARKQAEFLAHFAASVSLAPPPEGYKDVNEALQAGDIEAIRVAVEAAEDIPRPRPDGLPKNYQARADGSLEYHHQTEKVDEWRTLCSPLKVLAVTRDAAGRDFGRLIEVISPDRRETQVAVPMSSVATDGAEVLRQLSDLGFTFNRKARDQVLQLLMDWQPRSRAEAINRLGWSDASCRIFVLGTGEALGMSGAEPVTFQTEAIPEVALAMHPRGTVAEWRETVAMPAAGNPVLVLAISLAFAGPLLEPMNMQGGGVHLMGASSKGKTTTQEVARSVWGSPDARQTWRATSNGLEAVAACMNSTCLVLDEIGEVEAREAGRVAYMLANGAGKSRANRSGGARKVYRWREVFLSSGEITLADKVGEDGRKVKAGQQVRMADIPVTDRTWGVFDDLHGWDDPKRFADDLTRAASIAYGTAGPAFVSHILRGMPEARDRCHKRIESFAAYVRKKWPEADAQVLRVASRFGLIAAAGEIATEAGLTGWDRKEAATAVSKMFRAWIEARGSASGHEEMEAIRTVRAFLSAHGETRFRLLTKQEAGWREVEGYAVRDRAGWYQPPWDKEPGVYWITADAWSEITSGLNSARVARTLRDVGLLTPDADNRLACRTPRGIDGRPRAYAVLASILSADDRGRVDA